MIQIHINHVQFRETARIERERERERMRGREGHANKSEEQGATEEGMAKGGKSPRTGEVVKKIIQNIRFHGNKTCFTIDKQSDGTPSF